MSGEEKRLACIVDDDLSLRTGLVRFFRSCGIAAEAFASAREYLGRQVHAGPTCVILDVKMPELSGLDLQKILLERGTEEQIVFITGEGDVPMCATAMKAGAADFLPKPFDEEQLLDAVERALARSGLNRDVLDQQTEARRKVETLTRRERQVFEGVIAGKLNKEIAAELGTSLKTVKAQRGRVMEKMAVESVAGLVRLAQHAGIGSSKRS